MLPQPLPTNPEGLEAYFTDVEHLRDAFKILVAASALPRRLLVIHGVGGWENRRCCGCSACTAKAYVFQWRPSASRGNERQGMGARKRWWSSGSKQRCREIYYERDSIDPTTGLCRGPTQ